MSATFIVENIEESHYRLYWKPFMIKYPEYEYIFDSRLPKNTYIIKTKSWAIPAYDLMALLPSAVKNEENIIPNQLRIGNTISSISPPTKLFPIDREHSTYSIKGSIYIVG